MIRRFALIAGIGAAMIVPGTAGAAMLTVSGGAATLTGDGKANTLVAVDVEGLGTFFGDQTAGTNNPGLLAGCAPLNGAPAPFPGVVCLNITSVTMNGGEGADQLVANPATPVTQNGQGGADTLVGGLETDVFRGGTGEDRVAYVAPDGASIDRSAGVRATLPEPGAAAIAGNGRAGENDTIASDVEGLVGGQGNDTLTGNSQINVIAGAAPPGTPSVATAPAGNDTVVGGAGADTLLGGDTGSVDGGKGDDLVVGGRSTAAGAKTLVLGGSGQDSLVSGLGNDDFTGGKGADIIAYASAATAGLNRPQGVTVTLPEGDAPGRGGRTGGAEADVIRDEPETLVGGNGNDVLTGNEGPNQLVGVAPADTEGVTPGPPGNDTLIGKGGLDVMLASTGNDTLRGGGEGDVFIADAGDDTLFARDGAAEGADCGPGTDTVQADAVDTLTACENVDQPSGGGSDKTKPKVAVTPRKLRLRKGRRVRVFVRCRNEPKGCRGTVRLRRGKRVLAKRTFNAKSAKRKRVALRLSRKAVKRLKTKGRTAVRIRVNARDRSGNKRVKTVKATLRR